MTLATRSDEQARDGHQYGSLCRGCKHRKGPHCNPGNMMCHYLLDTDESRVWTNGKRDEKCVRILRWRVENGVPLTVRERERLLETCGK